MLSCLQFWLIIDVSSFSEVPIQWPEITKFTQGNFKRQLNPKTVGCVVEKYFWSQYDALILNELKTVCIEK